MKYRCEFKETYLHADSGMSNELEILKESAIKMIEKMDIGDLKKLMRVKRIDPRDKEEYKNNKDNMDCYLDLLHLLRLEKVVLYQTEINIP